MKLTAVRANPAGNITLFVLTAVDRAQRAAVAAQLMAQTDAEQVGFACAAAPGLDGAMEMCGGEFCGNAARAYGALLCAQRHLTSPTELTLRVSGCKKPVSVSVDPAAQTAFAEMPLPLFLREAVVGGHRGMLVHLGGIAHYVVSGAAPSAEFFAQAERELFFAMPTPEAYGVIFLDRASHRLTPLVKVPAVGSLFWEGSCASGTLCAALTECADMPDGCCTIDYLQRAGTLRAQLVRENGRILRAAIGGSVTLDPAITIEL